MYSRDQIDKVRASLDIVEVIRSYVPSLTVSGRSVRGLCPFHNERTPSFHVQPEKGFFKCFGCGEAGDVISFVSKLEGATFTETLEHLAAQVGVVLKAERGAVEKRQQDIKEKLFRLLDEAARIYQQILFEEVRGLAARNYLDFRGVGQIIRERFQLGMAPNSGTPVFETLVKNGFSFDLCQQAGLVARSKSGRFYDPLFGRLIFPIWDSFGHVVGFGGRVLPDQKMSVFGHDESEFHDQGPKYINSPESPVFQKGRLLYGLTQAKPEILKTRKVLIVEGYMDVIGVHQAGVLGAVATLGTAFTLDHAKLLRRYADQCVVFFDSDTAGQKAALKSLEPMIQESLFPRVVRSIGPLDPDEIILQKGRQEFDELVGKAPDFVDYLLGSLVGDRKLDLQQKNEVAQIILPLVQASSNELLKSEWIERLAFGLGLQRQSLENSNLSKRKTDHRDRFLSKDRRNISIPTVEEEVLQLIFSHPSVLAESSVCEEDFSELRQKRLFNLMKGQWTENRKISLPDLDQQFDPDERSWLHALLMEEKRFEDPKVRQEQLDLAFVRKRDKARLAFLGEQLRKGQNTELSIQTEYQTLLRRVKGSK